MRKATKKTTRTLKAGKSIQKKQPLEGSGAGGGVIPHPGRLAANHNELVLRG